MADFEKIVLVTRKTRLEGLIERFNTAGQARFYLEHSGGNFVQYQLEHDVYHSALDELRSELAKFGKFQEFERSFLPNFLFTEKDIVVTIGIDGLVVNTAKYLDGQPLIAVNPDPAHVDGILIPFTVKQAGMAVNDVFKGQAKSIHISMAEAALNDGQRLLAFNDLFIGARSHVSARYEIHHGERVEHHSSSGIIVSTGAGSTGWLSSIFNMANGVVAGVENQSRGGRQNASLKLGWSDERLFYVVREPFISKTSAAGLVCGFISNDMPLILNSEMYEGGVIFSDGVEADFLAFNAGMVATIKLAEKKTKLIVRHN